MRHHFLRSLFAVALAFFIGTSQHSLAEEAQTTTDRLAQLLRGQYPQLKTTQEQQLTTHAFNTRIFLIHHLLLTGAWQDAVETPGPQRGGILCTIESIPGRYAGAAAVPQDLDRIYFNERLMAPYSARQDRHLRVMLAYPDNIDPAFLKAFTEAVEKFAQE